MANGDIKITELPVGILVQGSLFITSEPEQGGGYISTKISATDIATLVASIVSYASLNTTSKTVIGAINEILSKAEGKFIVVQTLPVSDIDPFAIYLVPKQSPGQSDFYDEYIYTNNAWEKIGTTDIDLSNYYTKTQVDSLLSAKADTSSLATVATSGNYNDLTNKPTIPQIADNVIGNDSTYSSQKIISLMPTGEASGAVASFNTEIASPLVDCVLSINAQQASGTPTPDNPLPITGFTGANISHTHKNIFNIDNLVGANITNVDGVASGTSGAFHVAFGTNNGIPLKVPETQISITVSAYTDGNSSTTGDGLIVGVLYTDGTFNYLSFANSQTTKTSKTLSSLSNKTPKLVFISYSSDGVNIWHVSDFQVEIGQTATTYESYSGSTISVDWTEDAGTVYGGSLDLTTGVLTVDYASLDLGSLSWYYAGSGTANTRFQGSGIESLVKKATTQSEIVDLICSSFKNASVASIYNGNNYSVGVNTDGTIWIRDNDYTDAPNFKTAVTGITLYYPLATPIEYQLTPQEITAFVGVNNIWHDANGDTAVKFKQDIQGYIDEQIASVQALVLNS